MNEIRNTSKEGGMGVLLMGMLTGNPSAAIYQQEAEGQLMVVGQNPAEPANLPADIRQRDVFERWGIEFLGVVESDPIWQLAKLPSGWKLKSTEHSMWNLLLDDKGRCRGKMFYKAAFYDRHCHMVPSRRYTYSTDNAVENDYSGGKVGIVIDDGEDKVIWRSEKVHEGNYAYEPARQDAMAKLAEMFPDWESYDAYWE